MVYVTVLRILNFSCSLFVIRVNLPILNHPCSFMVYFYYYNYYHLFVVVFFILVNYYFQVLFNLKVILYKAKITRTP